MNIYSNSSHIALKYLKDIEVNIDNVLIITGDFNIRNSLWDATFPHHSTISDNLMIVADLFNLVLSTLTNSCPTRYSNMAGEANLVIDLMFFQYGSSKLNQHSIHPECYLSLDHVPLTIIISIADEIISTFKLSIPQNSKQETTFVKEIILIFKNLEISNITDKNNLENTVSHLETLINQAWTKNAKQSRITKHSKQWWMEECSGSLDNYRTTRSLENWKKFKKVIKNTKRSFFNIKIQEVVNKSHSPWELMNWINKCKLPAIKAIKYNGQPYFTPDSLWRALHATFNTVLHRQVNVNVLNKIGSKMTSLWVPFSKEEFRQAINKCNNLSAPGPDKLTWRHLKTILK